MLISTLVLAAALSPLPATQESPFLAGEVTLEAGRIPYRLLPPAEIREGERYPLVLFLHGAGERGDDNALQLKHFPERMAGAEYRAKYPCFVLAPQCPTDERWTEFNWSADSSDELEDATSWPLLGAIECLKEVARDHPVDTDRVYLTGLSIGGYGTWELARRQPDWFAAAAPVCGGGDPASLASVAGLPISVWHGDADSVVDVARSREMVAAVAELQGGVLEYHELAGVGHDAWTAAYGAEGCLDWLFAQRRAPDAELAGAARLFAEAVGPDERVAFLGDSITQAGNKPGGYVDLLRITLKDLAPGAEVIPAGISGHKVPDLLARLERDVIAKKATLVFVYIGINDVWHSTRGKGTPADAYEAGLHELVQRLHASGAKVVLATPSVIGELPAGENSLDAMLADYAAISRRVAEEEGLVLCDLQDAFLNHLALFRVPAKDRGVLTSDGVHLNPAGNAFVATQAARALRAALAKGE